MVIYRESIFKHLPKSQVMKEYYVQLKNLLRKYNFLPIKTYKY